MWRELVQAGQRWLSHVHAHLQGGGTVGFAVGLVPGTVQVPCQVHRALVHTAGVDRLRHVFSIARVPNGFLRATGAEGGARYACAVTPSKGSEDRKSRAIFFSLYPFNIRPRN